MTIRTFGAVSTILATLAGCGDTYLEELGTSADPSCPPSDPGVTDPTQPPGDTPPGTPGDGVTTPGETVPGTTPGGTTTPGTTGGTTAPPAPTPVRFLVLGDGGRGNDAQYAVANGMEQVCAAHGCDFALYVGDNIYDSGVDSVDDEQFQEKFEMPYANLNFPFYMALGNHDHGGNVDAQVEYSSRSTRWTMPARWYAHAHGDATFYALDSDLLEGGETAEQAAWIQGQLAKAATTWKFAYGHHPYISNGDHGNGSGDMRGFVEENLCGKVDIYFAGHDHHLEWLEPQCGTEFIISGGASDLRSVGSGEPSFWGEARNGVLWVEILGNQLTGVFYDENATELYRRVITK